MDESGQENKLFIIISGFVQLISPLKGSSRKTVELFLPKINLEILPSVTCTLHVRYSLLLICITHLIFVSTARKTLFFLSRLRAHFT